MVEREERVALFLAVLSVLGASTLAAQTATTGLVSGLVTDPSGASVPSAAVEMKNDRTGLTLSQTTNAAGQFVLASVPPGSYELRVTAAGFRQFVVGGLRVEVTRSYVQNVTLEVGQITESVVVAAQAVAELQMVDATVGNVLSSASLPVLPTFTRQLIELLSLQPGATPSGEVTGARTDQSTYSLDGIDVTNQSVGGQTAYMYLGVEGVSEFRVGVTNPNASFGRGAGGQVSMVSRRGTNDLHGSAFWYHQNDNLNANNWTNNRSRIKKPELKDNRFGFLASGPAWKDKTFLMANYEGRRFPRSGTVSRNVPTESLRQGVLRFRDAAGNINSYPLATSTACGAEGTERCDPRGLGQSPAIAALWQKMPAGNDTSQGDGLNTIGFTGTVFYPINSGFYLARLDHHLTQSWRLEASLRYFRQLDQNNGSLDIRGGNIASIRSFPTRQNMETVALSGAFRPNLTAEFRFGRVRHRAATDVLRPSASATILGIPGASTPDGAIALDIGARGGAQNVLSEPFDVDTQLARKQQNDARVYQYNADLNWIKRTHSFQFGAHIRHLPTLHRRDDKVVGSLGSLVAQIDAQLGSLILPASMAPPVCGAGRTTGCLQTGDVQQWNRLYAGMAGLIDNVSVLAVRDGSFKPLPYGELLESDTKGIRAPEFYFQDVWRITSSLTLTYGLNYGWQTPPNERLGRYTLQVDAASGKIISADEHVGARKNAALRGEMYNPNFAFLPIQSAKGQPVFNIDWKNLGPRAAAAWNPSLKGGWLGRLLGDRRTVVRGGYALVYDRLNTVSSVIVPSLGIGFAQTLNVTMPACNASGAGGPGCNPSSSNPAASVFRVGIDGAIPRPVVPQQTVPVSPAWGMVGGRLVTFPEVLSFQVDPSLKQGRHHSLDFTIQREIKGDMILELAYAGRMARKLQQSVNLLQAPYIHLDKASGQTFAQAFDNVAIALRQGGTAANQPWFDNNVPGGTAYMVQTARASFIAGNINSLFLTLDQQRMRNNLQPFNNYMSQMMLMKTSNGRSNYNALLATLRKRLSRGFQFDLNYTWSKSLDQLGAWQNAASQSPNSFEQNVEYGPSTFDITHMFNGFWLYQLPFRTDLPVLKQLINGWEVSGIVTARGGDALTVTQGSQVWGGALYLGFNSGAIPTVKPSSFGNQIQRDVRGSNNIGTNSDPANRGSGLNLYANPEQVHNSFRRVEISRDGRAGRANPLRGPTRWNVDTSLGKRTHITERIAARFSFDFFNILNKVDYANPSLDLNNPRGFGVITTQFTPPNRVDGSRWIQFGLRVEF
ncbi:MAG: carboxypeptidase regulatory-like domain-containing protein [Acidobacteria bacterium]|nr:carboxypeptidase regulatory-like domain-containing protein [Acidobacteriota bacterium]